MAFLLVPVGVSHGRAAQPFIARVQQVVDGDSLELDRNGRMVPVRLHGIDCPEWDQPYGREAREFVEANVLGRVVTIRQLDTDDFGRMVAELRLADGRSLNAELIRAGLAWWYRRYAPRDGELERLEQAARASRKGLWSDTGARAPWVWRRQQR